MSKPSSKPNLDAQIWNDLELKFTSWRSVENPLCVDMVVIAPMQMPSHSTGNADEKRRASSKYAVLELRGPSWTDTTRVCISPSVACILSLQDRRPCNYVA